MWSNNIQYNTKYDVSFDFSACWTGIKSLFLNNTKKDMDALIGENSWAFIYAAGIAIAPEKFTGKFDIPDDAQNEIIHLCYEFNQKLNELDTLNSTIETLLKEYKSLYSDKYNDEYKVLSDWYIEAKSYAEFASTPVGSYNSYSSERQNYQTSISKYQTKASLLG